MLKKIMKHRFVKDSAIHPNEVFVKIKDMFEDEISSRGLTYYFGEEVETHDGSSYSGFISFCDGWVEAVAAVVLNPFSPGSTVWMKDEKCKKILESLEDSEGILKEIYESEYKDKFATFEEFDEAYLDSAHGESDAVDYEKVDEELMDWYAEAPAFIKVRLLLNGNTAKLSAFFNDDLSYGRESVGSWAGKNSVGEPFGDHVIEEYETTFDDYDELYAFVEKNLPKVFDSFEID